MREYDDKVADLNKRSLEAVIPSFFTALLATLPYVSVGLVSGWLCLFLWNKWKLKYIDSVFLLLL
ncbi:MAG TPA: hypothetical protein VGR07_00880, partial [Thermoanaerobaculia bacterium]|nr:hypothetical protein [Thermoanaerobaculia bacterium]